MLSFKFYRKETCDMCVQKLKNKLKAGERYKLTNYRRTALIQKGVLHEHLSKCIPPEMTNNSTDIITNPRSMQQKRVVQTTVKLVTAKQFST